MMPKDPETNETWRGRLGAALVWWALLFAIWLALVDKSDLAEDLAGLASAGVAAFAVMAVRVSGGANYAPGWGWLPRARRVPGQVLHDCGVVARAIWRRIVHRDHVEGIFRAIPFDPGGDDPRSAARRALVIAGVSMAPNTVVITVDCDEGFILLHQLIPTAETPGKGDREWPL